MRVESVRRRALERRRQRGGTTDAAVRATAPARVGQLLVCQEQSQRAVVRANELPGSEAGEVNLDAVLRRSDAAGSDSTFRRGQPAKTGLKSENMQGLAR